MNKIVYLILVILIIASCTSNEEKQKKEKQSIETNIARLEKIISNDTTGQINIAAAYEIIRNYASYSYKFPNDSNTPEYIFRMANILNALGKFREAVEAFHKIESKYPDYNKLDICIFLQGNIYETELKDLEKARYYYELFIQKYPSHPLSKDVKVLLENLGKSPEELLKSIQQKNKHLSS
ncbi:MAG: tetratricopeptide repeat protein [Bacteroidales bacterium]|nr:tetratricopeptide repeat protein [Bacteroidales bacterium]